MYIGDGNKNLHTYIKKAACWCISRLLAVWAGNIGTCASYIFYFICQKSGISERLLLVDIV